MRVCKHGCDILDSCVFFENNFIKTIEHFFRVYITSSKHLEGLKNSRKYSTVSRVCITVSNSPNPPHV